MPRTFKSAPKLNLLSKPVLIEDTKFYSEYFEVSDLNRIFHSGKNGFLIRGTEFLKLGTDIYIEVLDRFGDSIYLTPVDGVSEGGSRLISVFVYEKTERGPGKLIIMGTAERYSDGSPIPEQYKNIPNVRWVIPIQIEPNNKNTSKIVLSNVPTASVYEKSFATTRSVQSIVTSSLYTASLVYDFDVQKSDGYAIIMNNNGQVPISFFDISHINPHFTGSISKQKIFRVYNTTGSVLDSIVYDMDIPLTASIYLDVEKVLNENVAITNNSIKFSDGTELYNINLYSGSFEQIIQEYEFIDTDLHRAQVVYLYTSSIAYEYTKETVIQTGNTSSILNFNLTNVATSVGEISKVRILAKEANSSITSYQYFTEFSPGEKNLLVVTSSIGDVEIGYFSQNSYLQDNWFSSLFYDTNGDFNKTDYENSASAGALGKSLVTSSYRILEGAYVSGVAFNDQYFFGPKKPIQLEKDAEYTLKYTAVYSPSRDSVKTNIPGILYVYFTQIGNTNSARLSSSVVTTDKDPYGKLIDTIQVKTNDKSLYEREVNFTLPRTGHSYLRFVSDYGFWDFGAIEITPAVERGFNPDEIVFDAENNLLINSTNIFKIQYLNFKDEPIEFENITEPLYISGSNITKLIKLIPDRTQFKFSGIGVPSPVAQTASISVEKTNINDSLVYSLVDDNITPVNPIYYSQSADNLELYVGSFGNPLVSSSVLITATAAGVSDKVRILAVRDGADLVDRAYVTQTFGGAGVDIYISSSTLGWLPSSDPTFYTASFYASGSTLTAREVVGIFLNTSSISLSSSVEENSPLVTTTVVGTDSRSLTVIITSGSLETRETFTVTTDGITGLDGKVVTLLADDYSILYTDVGGVTLPSPTEVHLTASAQNHEVPTYYEFLVDGLVVQNTTNNLYTYTVPSTIFKTVHFQVNTRETTPSSSIVSADSLNIFGLKYGQSSFTPTITNENHTFTSNEFGVVSSYVGGGTEIEVLFAGNNLTPTLSTPTSGQFSASISQSVNITPSQPPTIVGNRLIYGDPSGMSSVIHSGSVSYLITAVTGSITNSFVKKQSYNKSIKGMDSSYGILQTDAVRIFNSSSNGWNQTTKTGVTASFYYGSTLTAQELVNINLNTSTKSLTTSSVSDSALITSTISGSGTNTLLLTFTSASRQVSETFNVVLAGTDGDDGVTVQLNLSDYSIVYSSLGTSPSPTYISASVTSQGLTSPTYNWYRTGSLHGTGATQVFNVPTSQFTSQLIEVHVSQSSTGYAKDGVTIYGVGNGSSGFTVLLTNEAHTFAASGSGLVPSYAGGGTNIEVLYGPNNLTPIATPLTVSTSGSFTSSVLTTNNITAGAPSLSSPYFVWGSPSNMTADSASIVYAVSASVSGSLVYFSKIQSFTKSKKGKDSQYFILDVGGAKTFISSSTGITPTGVTPVTASVYETGSIVESLRLNVFTSAGSLTSSIIQSATNISSSFSSSISSPKRLDMAFSFFSGSIRVGNETFIISTDGKPGVDGTNGSSGQDSKAISLTIDDYSIIYSEFGTVPTPTYITARATPQNVTSPSYQWYVDGVNVPASTSATFAYAVPTTLFDSKLISVGLISASVLVASDSASIFGVRNGVAGFTPILSNEAHTFPAGFDGTVTSYVGGGTDIEVLYGGLNLTPSLTTPTSGQFSSSISASTNITPVPVYTITGSYLRYAAPTAMVVANHSGSIVYLITAVTGSVTTTFKKTQSFTKSLRGTDSSYGLLEIDGTRTFSSGSLGWNQTAKTGVTASFYLGSTLTAQERVNVTLNTTTKSLTTASISDSALITSAWSGSGTNTLILSFTSSSRKVSETFNVILDGQTGSTGATGATGGSGPGIVYRGTYSASVVYYSSSIRRDVVGYGGTYYISDVNNTTAPTPPTGWTAFGSQFSSVATDILFAQDVYSHRTINIGTNLSGSTPLIALVADTVGGNKNPYISMGQTTAGYRSGSGVFLGYDTSTPKMSLSGSSGGLFWDGSSLVISGSIKIVAGSGIASLSDAGSFATLSQITSGNVATYIGAGSITTTQIAATTIVAGNIASNTITGTNIASMNLTSKNLIATLGTVGGWGLGASSITSSGTSGGGDGTYTSAGMILGSTGYISSPNFMITSAGVLYAKSAILSGSIQATAGTIGGITITSTQLNVGSTLLLKNTGELTASAAQITGNITATSGQIGGWTVSSTAIYRGTLGSNGTFTTNGGDITLGAGWISAKNFLVDSSGNAKYKGEIISVDSNGTASLESGMLYLTSNAIYGGYVSINPSSPYGSGILDVVLMSTGKSAWKFGSTILGKSINIGNAVATYDFTGSFAGIYYGDGSNLTGINTGSLSITDTSTTAGTYYPLFASNYTGTQILRGDSSYTWNPNTNTLSIGVLSATSVTASIMGSNVIGTVSSASLAANSEQVRNSVTFDVAGGATRGTTYNGSVARTISFATVGAASASHAHSTSDITSGTLSIARGGTNNTSFTTNGLIYYDGSKLAYASYTTTDAANWNTAYGWGNHATAGYITSVTVTAGSGLTGGGTGTSLTLNVGAGTGISVAADSISLASGVVAPGTYSGGISSVTVDTYGRVTAITGTAGYLTSESDTLATVTGRGATTSTAISITNATAATNISTGALIITGGLGVGGAIYAGSDIVAYGSSDIRLKKNVVKLNDALKKVNLISGYTFDWNEEKQNLHKGNDVGVVAQEIKEVLPQIVTIRDNGYLAIKYEKIIPLLIEAIKELSNKIDNLEERFNK